MNSMFMQLQNINASTGSCLHCCEELLKKKNETSLRPRHFPFYPQDASCFRVIPHAPYVRRDTDRILTHPFMP